MSKKRKQKGNNFDAMNKKNKGLTYCERFEQLLDKKINDDFDKFTDSIKEKLDEMLNNPADTIYIAIHNGYITVTPTYNIFRATFDRMDYEYGRRLSKLFGFYGVHLKYNSVDYTVTVTFRIKNEKESSEEY